MVAVKDVSLEEVLGLDDGVDDREVSRKLICFYTAQGVAKDDVAKKLNVSGELVDVVTTSQYGTAEVVRMQGLLYRHPRDRVNRLASIALDKLTAILTSSQDDKLVATVAEKLLDRSMGKAVQVIENRNFNFDAKDVDALDSAIKVQMDRMSHLETMHRRLKEAKEAHIIDGQ